MERVEEYLEAIYDIQKKGRVAKTGELAKILKIKPASVTEMLVKLKDSGYIDYSPYKGATLTKKGEEIAENIKKRFEAAFRFFKFLGLSDEVAEKLSCELEHHINDEIVEKLNALSGKICLKCEKSVKRLSCVSAGKYEVVSCPKDSKVKVGDIIDEKCCVKDKDLVLVRKV